MIERTRQFLSRNMVFLEAFERTALGFLGLVAAVIGIAVAVRANDLVEMQLAADQQSHQPVFDFQFRRVDKADKPWMLEVSNVGEPSRVQDVYLTQYVWPAIGSSVPPEVEVLRDECERTGAAAGLVARCPALFDRYLDDGGPWVQYLKSVEGIIGRRDGFYWLGVYSRLHVEYIDVYGKPHAQSYRIWYGSDEPDPPTTSETSTVERLEDHSPESFAARLQVHWPWLFALPTVTPSSTP